ncbi:hypothetical protein F2Q69_00063459 [Brassica cretica]|uniref:Uncharacterized protein n=1 Tax=Brassica cretica TaxID=69181 RepID=A0A8S9RLE5_BRACR|nr:hypothetical protein F2Q69_00063459 [Brassica cretica]
MLKQEISNIGKRIAELEGKEDEILDSFVILGLHKWASPSCGQHLHGYMPCSNLPTYLPLGPLKTLDAPPGRAADAMN